MISSDDVSHIFAPVLLFAVLLVISPVRVFEAENTFSYEIKKVATYDSLKVDVTWYTSSVQETDSTPFVTADGSRVKDGIIAVSHNLLAVFEYGDSLYVEDLGWFEVHDCMHQRWMNAVDIWCGDSTDARQNGRQQKWIYWNFREETIWLIITGV